MRLPVRQVIRVTGQLRPYVLPMALGAIIALFHLLTANDSFGLFRDELYYIANSEHLGLGYVDHPPLVGWLTWLGRIVLGESMVAIRVLPALAAGATGLCTAMTARAMGGSRTAEILAATATAVAPVYIANFGKMSMNSYDILVWSAASWVLARVFRDGDGRGWILFGAVTGVGLQNKLSVLFLGFGLVVGLALTLDLRTFKDRRLWIGGAVAAVLFSPHVIWQVVHGWPTLEFIENAATRMLPLTPVEFLLGQITEMQPSALPLIVSGLCFLLFTQRGRPFRALGWAFVAITILLITQTSKVYYLSPAYTMVFAAGAVAVTRLTSRRGLRWVGPSYIALLIFSGAVVAPLAKPLLTVERTISYGALFGDVARTASDKGGVGRLSQDLADRLGWFELAKTVAEVNGTLSAEERARVCILGQNYGQAAAIDYYGPRYGLPAAISGHNSYWLWGPRDCTGEVLIVIDYDREDLEAFFEQVELATTYTCEDCRPFENNKPIWVVRKVRMPFERFWSQIKFFV